MRIMFILCFLIIPALLFAQDVVEEPVLQVELSSRIESIIKLSELKDTLTAAHIQLYDPYYKKNKEYKAFLLKDLLEYAFGNNLNSSEYSELIFIAKDGYQSITSIQKAIEPGGFVVFEDVQYPDWELIEGRNVSPAPFYIVWKESRQTDANSYPWTWQLMTIKLVSFREQYPEVYPKSVDENSNIFAGFELFKEHCFRCHSMNRQGGKVGPDLNAPRSVVSYRSEFMIKEMIKRPSSYRYGKMPDHPDLTSFDLDNLIEYFNHMNRFKN